MCNILDWVLKSQKLLKHKKITLTLTLKIQKKNDCCRLKADTEAGNAVGAGVK